MSGRRPGIIDLRDEIGELDTTIDQWKAALEQPDDPGLTITELAEALFVSETTMRRHMKKMLADGKVEKGFAVRNSHKCIVYELKGK